jgi:general secretion pathway protein G
MDEKLMNLSKKCHFQRNNQFLIRAIDDDENVLYNKQNIRKEGSEMKISKENGFTLIEVIIVAGIIAILAGILVPLILKEIDESRIAKANGDIRSVFASMLVFKKDTAQWPVMDGTCDPNVTLLTGDGNLPGGLAAMGYDTSVSSSYNDHLPRDANGCYSNWKGSYIARVTADPWGNSYVTNVDGFGIANRPVWILSVGENGQLETPSFSDVLFGDDIGLRIK